MTTEEMRTKLIELENHFIHILSEEEMDWELKELRASVLTRLYAIQHILQRRLRNGTTEINKTNKE